jgi:hypothetical protein
VTLFQDNELVIKFRMFSFGSPGWRHLGFAIAILAITFMFLVLMFGAVDSKRELPRDSIDHIAGQLRR